MAGFGTWKTRGVSVGHPLGSAGDPVGERPNSEAVHDTEVEVLTDVDADPELDPGLSHVRTLLNNLRPFSRVQLWRTKPTWCAGFLTNIDIARGEELDLDQIKRDWGGGEIQFRPQVRTPAGMKYARGGGTLPLTGPPRERGVEITPHGMFEAPAAARSPVVVETRPASTRSISDAAGPWGLVQTMFQGMLGMMQQNMQQSMQQNMQPQQAAPRVVAPDPLAALGQLEGTLKIFKRLQATLQPDDDDDDDDDDAEAAATPTDRLLGMLVGQLEQKMASKGSKPATPAKPAATRSWRLHTTPGAPAGKPTSAASAARMREMLEALPQEEQMEVLGELSSKIDPELIQAWMAQQFGKDRVAG